MHNIRNIKKSDISEIINIGKSTEEFDISEDEEKFWPEESLRKWIDNDDDIILVAEKDNNIIGFILSHMHKPTGKVEIENIYVKKDYRREGIGRSLQEELLSRYKKKKESVFAVGLVLKNNKKMHNFKEDMNFERGENLVWWEYKF